MKQNYCEYVKMDIILQDAVYKHYDRSNPQIPSEIDNHMKQLLGMQRCFKIRTKWIKHERTLMRLNCVEEASKYTIYYHDVVYISS